LNFKVKFKLIMNVKLYVYNFFKFHLIKVGLGKQEIKNEVDIVEFLIEREVLYDFFC